MYLGIVLGMEGYPLLRSTPASFKRAAAAGGSFWT